MVDLSKGTAVITGAGSGLGRALAVELARKMPVVGFGRRMETLQKTAALVDNFTPMQVDVADPQAVSDAFAQIGPVSVLLNNAAVYPRRDFLDETGDSFARTLQINLGGMVNCCHAALKTMVETGEGRILNVASFADIAPLPASSAYSVSKGAGRILTRALVADLGDRFPDIVITDWLPGMLATGMGIPDGLKPQTAAKWGAKLALWHDPALNGVTFEMDHELLPPQSLKRRLKNKLLLRRSPAPRLL
jgi:NADP-dependent 3-hydroxy acid dehydrogenase YdfG